MSNYTEADAKRDTGRLAGYVSGVGVREDREALARLEAAALEGAKVPGLVADNAALHQRAMDALSVATEPVTAFQRAHKANAALADLLEQPRPGAALLAEHEAKVSALQARVKELERERDAREEQAFGLRQSFDGATKRVAVLVSERDALRAQVDAVDDIASGVVLRGEGEAQESLAHRILATISAPPAETTPAPERAQLEAWKIAHNADCTCTRCLPGMKGPHKVGCPAGVRLGEPQAPCVKCGTAPLLPPPAPAPLCWSHDHEGQ